jgi:hypothetical protein
MSASFQVDEPRPVGVLDLEGRQFFGMAGRDEDRLDDGGRRGIAGARCHAVEETTGFSGFTC